MGAAQASHIARTFPMTRPLRVKFILPALTEATEPLLAADQVLAVSAARAGHARRLPAPDDEAAIDDEHVEPARAPRHPTTAPISSSFRSTSPTPAAPTGSPTRYRASGVFVALGGLHVTSLPDEAAPHADAIFLGPGRADVPAVPRATSAPARPQPRYRSTTGRTLEHAAADPPRSHQPPPLSRAELDRRHARLSAALRLLLQGRVLRRRPFVLHPARRRRARRDRSRCRDGISTFSTITCSATGASRRRCSTACGA